MHLDLVVVMADQVGALRDYRKGNWTLQETMILIEAKKMDDERRMKKLSGDHQMMISSSSSSNDQLGGVRSIINKPTELRWKWVEDYCWRKGCFRSQNQCNDKWDNLMRDYKRVRDYEKTRLLLLSSKNGNNDDKNEEEGGCYWKIEKSERKGKNLPSNMLQQIYEALVEVVERKGSSSSQQQQQQQPQRLVGMGYHVNVVELRPPVHQLINVVAHQAQPIHQIPPPPPAATAPILQALLPLLPPAPPAPPPAATAAMSEPPAAAQPLPAATTPVCDRSSGSDNTSGGGGCSESPPPPPLTTTPTVPIPKRKRRKGGEEGTSSSSSFDAISKGALMISQAIEACEERGETRHKELLRLHERRLHIEESNTQGIHALVHAINNLANSILALASNNSTTQTPPK